MPIKTLTDEQPALNLTSMIDVMFLLVIFFMVGTKFSDAERSMSVKVPKVGQTGALTPAPEKRIVNVHQDGRITLDRQTLTIDELQEVLRKARRHDRSPGVVVRADGQGAFQHVANVLAACRNAGVSELGISVQVADKAQAPVMR
jgi:biopolymer transport protein ExbD